MTAGVNDIINCHPCFAHLINSQRSEAAYNNLTEGFSFDGLGVGVFFEVNKRFIELTYKTNPNPLR
ncbi:hypothetical protein BH09BAC5_BH09BAC5_13080 [soil metagenome]